MGVIQQDAGVTDSQVFTQVWNVGYLRLDSETVERRQDALLPVEFVDNAAFIGRQIVLTVLLPSQIGGNRE